MIHDAVRRPRERMVVVFVPVLVIEEAVAGLERFEAVRNFDVGGPLFVRVHLHGRRVARVMVDPDSAVRVQGERRDVVRHVVNLCPVQVALVVVVAGGAKERQVLDKRHGSAEAHLHVAYVARRERVQVPECLRMLRPVISDVSSDGSVVFLSPFHGDDVHDPGHRLAVLGVERSADHLHLAHRAVFDLEADAAVIGVGDRDAVDEVGDLVEPAAAEVPADDARLQIHDRQRIVHGDHLDVFG